MSDITDLALAVLGLDDDASFEVVEQALADKFEISFENFEAIVKALIPFTIPARAALSGDLYHGFVRDGWFILKESKP